MSQRLVSILRWALFVPVVLIQAGSYLGGEFLTGVTGTLLAFLLTIHQRSVTEKLELKYRYVFLGFVALFLAGSYVDAKYY